MFAFREKWVNKWKKFCLKKLKAKGWTNSFVTNTYTHVIYNGMFYSIYNCLKNNNNKYGSWNYGFVLSKWMFWVGFILYKIHSCINLPHSPKQCHSFCIHLLPVPVRIFQIRWVEKYTMNWFDSIWSFTSNNSFRNCCVQTQKEVFSSLL